MLFTLLSATLATTPGCQTDIRALLAAPRPIIRFANAGLSRTERPIFGSFDQKVSSEHFLIQAGPSFALTAHDAQPALDALELAWKIEVNEMQLPAPPSTDAHFLNVYVGNSGGGAPEIPFEGAYVSIDESGVPYIVFHPSLIGETAPGQMDIDFVAYHEFFHTVQFGTGFYANDNIFAADVNGWYWEATANWAAWYIDPTLDYQLALYPLYPQASLSYFEFSDNAASILNGHQYTAAAFPIATSILKDPQIVRDTWARQEEGESPLDAMDRALHSFDGSSVREAFAEFGGRNATWDWPRGTAYASMSAQFARYYDEGDQRITHTLDADSAFEPLLAQRPGGYGYNVIALPARASTIDVTLNAAGSGGTTGEWTAVLSHTVDGAPIHEEIALESFAIALEIPASSAPRYLTLAATPDRWRGGETFSYQTSATTLVHDGGVGCSVSHARSRMGSVVLALLTLLASLGSQKTRAGRRAILRRASLS